MLRNQNDHEIERSEAYDMRFGSLFAGIGGFDLGLERAGMTCAWQVEIDDYATKILEKHWPAVTKFRDVRTVGSHNLEPVDLICGGFPCQDISLAGKGAGLSGERSGLWFEFRRILEEVRPRFAIIENVPALRSRGLDQVLGALAALGYDAEWHCIPASAFGAPHRRDRVWILAYAKGQQDRWVCEQKLQSNPRTSSEMAYAKSPIIQRDRPEQGGEQSGFTNSGWWEIEPDVGGIVNGLSAELDGGKIDATETEARISEILSYVQQPHVSETLQRATRRLDCLQAEEVLFSFVREYEEGGRLSRELLESEATPEGIMRNMRSNRETTSPSLRRESAEQYFREHSDAMRKLSCLVASRGKTPWDNPLWESKVKRVADGVPKRVARLRCLGNAIVPQVAEWIGKQIMTTTINIAGRVG